MKKNLILIFLLIGLQLSVYGQEKVINLPVFSQQDQLSASGNPVSLASDAKIGGRNYVINSAFLENYSGWDITGKCFTETKDGLPSIGLNRVGNYSTDGYAMSPQMSNLMINEFTLSFLVWSINGFVLVDFDGDYDATLTKSVTAGSWQKVEFHVSPGKIIRNLRFALYGNDSQKMDGWVTRFKLEYGNQTTDWSPAPEDLNQKFTEAGINSANKSMTLNKLDVNGTIRAKEVLVQTSWADFVFEEDYILPSLEEVATHIKAKKHLPGIPSAKEVEKDGVSLGEINTLLLQKIEELTLYTIRQQELIEKLEDRVQQLEK